MKIRNHIFAASLAILMSVLYFSCASGDDARITIKLVRNDLAAVTEQARGPSLVDRVLRFFSTPAYGFSYYWDQTKRDTLMLTVDHPSFASFDVSIPPNATEFSVIVPAGDVTLTVLSLGSNQDTGDQYYNWGGRATVGLNAGDNITVSIFMLPIIPVDPNYTSASQSSSVTITLYPVMVFTYPYSNCVLILERSNSPGGTYAEVGTNNWPTSGSLTVSDPDAQSGNIPLGTYYYRVKIRYTYWDADEVEHIVTGLPGEPYAVYYLPIF